MDGQESSAGCKNIYLLIGDTSVETLLVFLSPHSTTIPSNQVFEQSKLCSSRADLLPLCVAMYPAGVWSNQLRKPPNFSFRAWLKTILAFILRHPTAAVGLLHAGIVDKSDLAQFHPGLLTAP